MKQTIKKELLTNESTNEITDTNTTNNNSSMPTQNTINENSFLLSSKELTIDEIHYPNK